MSQTNAVKVLDLFRTPPNNNPYGHLKDDLLWMYAFMDYVHYEAITSLPLSGDMLPSTLMSKKDALSLTPPSASCPSDSLDLCWYHRNQNDRAQKCRAPCFGGETSFPAGGCFHPTCWFYRIFSSVSSRRAFFLMVSGGLWCLGNSFSSTCLHLYL